jgi:RNA polymerase sigma-70 factor (sigma-E family)
VREDQQQFREFVATRSARLFRVALALTGTHDAAEDLLQGALVRTFARWGHVREDPEAYVRRAMYHAQMSVWRRRRKLRELPAGDVPDRADGRDDMGDTDQRLAVRLPLLRLGPRQRAVLVARFFEDLSERQTAALLGCSPGTVRSQTHRALVRLREIAPELRNDDLAKETMI